MRDYWEHVSEPVARVIDRIAETYDGASDNTQSPIEDELLYALTSGSFGWMFDITRAKTISGVVAFSGTQPDGRIALATQVSVDRYRCDLMIATGRSFGSRLIAIECDGFEFHNKFAWQRERDARRDRNFWRSGVQVMRFSGSRIMGDVRSVVNDIAAEIGLSQGAEHDE